MKTETLERFSFETAGELRDWLNQFKETDLDKVLLFKDGSKAILLDWNENSIDGNKLNSICIR